MLSRLGLEVGFCVLLLHLLRSWGLPVKTLPPWFPLVEELGERLLSVRGAAGYDLEGVEVRVVAGLGNFAEWIVEEFLAWLNV